MGPAQARCIHVTWGYLREISFAVMGTAVPPPPHELHAINPRPLQVAHPTSESDHRVHIHGTTPAALHTLGMILNREG